MSLVRGAGAIGHEQHPVDMGQDRAEVVVFQDRRQVEHDHVGLQQVGHFRDRTGDQPALQEVGRIRAGAARQAEREAVIVAQDVLEEGDLAGQELVHVALGLDPDGLGDARASAG